MKKTLMVVIALLLLIAGSYYGYQMLYPKPITTTSDSPLPYTLEQIAEHNSKESCWTLIEGKVYDVTPFVASGFHPGKDAILQGCGRDATELFNTRPMGSMTPHSDKARGNLPQYMIGELTK